MPTYSYACTQCADRFDVVQAFTDDALTTCQKCSGRLRKLFNAVGVVFKGSGFYRTDSRESTKTSKGSTEGAASSDASTTASSNASSGSSSSEAKSSGSGEKSTSSAKTSATAVSS
ncbi:putative regulatory protein, FmdB family [Mycobacterium basiliense]|uniref:Putative regulatory protein, FmdB family n=1 Tax=Mycobacterium basiliense TaxID=2094119 RepID=A0A3S4FTG2_9MYCO|nr:FmdB family zinc ribbon protein [Mycobacterium basiliense]VDM90361.1 putative regulatory protein, FmdB family [Mycobacterium basiliense]